MIKFSIYCHISISIGKRDGLCGKINPVDHESRHGARTKTVASARAGGDCVGGFAGND